MNLTGLVESLGQPKNKYNSGSKFLFFVCLYLILTVRKTGNIILGVQCLNRKYAWLFANVHLEVVLFFISKYYKNSPMCICGQQHSNRSCSDLN